MSRFFKILSSIYLPLGRAGVGFSLLLLSACSSTQFTIDDAYHWEDRSAIATTTATPSSTTSSSSSTSSGPSLEFTNVQDTTITVRIKR